MASCEICAAGAVCTADLLTEESSERIIAALGIGRAYNGGSADRPDRLHATIQPPSSVPIHRRGRMFGRPEMAAATATVNRPPTEAEIREVIADNTIFDADFGTVIHRYVSAIAFGPDEYGIDEDSRIWTDLRPSETKRLGDLIDEVYDLADKFQAEVVEATVRAALTFAAEYPDATRAADLRLSAPEDLRAIHLASLSNAVRQSLSSAMLPKDGAA